MDCRVVVEAAVPVYDVETVDEAVRIAIAKTGEMLNPDLSYVDIEMGDRTSPGGEALPPAFVAADEALVALELEMTVFSVESPEHADRIARTEIGKRLEGVPLKVLDTERLAGETHEGDEGDQAGESGSPVDAEAGAGGDENDAESESDEKDDGESRRADKNRERTDDLLPEFEEMVDENRR